jgi:hypothetical protein
MPANLSPTQLCEQAEALKEARTGFPHTDVTCDKVGSPSLYGVTIGGCNLEEGRWKMADIRGWGSLAYLGEDEAITIQEGMGDFFALAANTTLPIIAGYQQLIREARDILQRILALPKIKAGVPIEQQSIYTMNTDDIERTLARLNAALGEEQKTP